jgi:hypothetical protein
MPCRRSRFAQARGRQLRRRPGTPLRPGAIPRHRNRKGNSRLTPALQIRRIAVSDQEKVDALAGDLADWATSNGTRQARTFAWYAKALAATGRGDFETAYQNAAAISPAGTFARYEPPALWACPDLVEGAVAIGRGAAARAHADAMNRHRLADISPRLARLTSGRFPADDYGDWPGVVIVNEHHLRQQRRRSVRHDWQEQPGGGPFGVAARWSRRTRAGSP